MKKILLYNLIRYKEVNMNNDDMNSNQNNEEKIIDPNLLNPFQNNVNNNSQSLNNPFVNDNQNNNISSTSSNGVNNKIVPPVQTNVKSSNESVNNPIQSNIPEVNNSTTLENHTINNDVSQNISAPVNVQSMNDSISNSANTNEQSCSLFLILAIVSICGFFTGGIITIIGIILCIISLIGSIIMLKKKAKLSGVSLGVSLIIFIIYVLSFVLAFKTVKNFVDQTKASIFKDYAVSFSMQAKQNVILSKKISCDEESLKSTRESLPELANGGKVSPFGGNFDYNSSYVLVEASEINGHCQYKASIYLTDGKYSIGTSSNPVSENDINSASINNN